MTSQIVWIGIAVGLFFAGIGVSYAYFASSKNEKMYLNEEDKLQGFLAV